jgi:hypothetical protein
MLRIDSAIDGNMEDFRQSNRRVANVAACHASAESPEAETKRSKAAMVVNAMLRMTSAQVGK